MLKIIVMHFCNMLLKMNFYLIGKEKKMKTPHKNLIKLIKDKKERKYYSPLFNPSK